MKLTLLPIAVLAGVVAAGDQPSVSGVPACARPCVNKFTTGGMIAGCTPLDIECICSNKDFLSSIACCLKSECDQADQDQAVAYAKGICSSAGVTVPNQVVCDTSTNSTSSSTASSSSSSSTASSGAATTAAVSSSSSSSSSASASPSAKSTGAAAAVSGVGTGGVLGAVLAVVAAL